MKKILLFIIIFICIIFFPIIYIKFIDIINFKCFFKEYLHIYCAGCGFTRMFKEIINLNFYQAFRYNPLMFFILPFLSIYTFYLTIIYFKNRKINYPNIKIYLILFFISLLFMILRNTSTFSFLAPTIIK